MILNFGFDICVITLIASYWKELGFAHPNSRVDYNLSFVIKPEALIAYACLTRGCESAIRVCHERGNTYRALLARATFRPEQLTR